MKINCIKETCIYVTDLEATRQFYQDTLGLPLISMVNDRHVFFRAGTSVLLCFLALATMHEKELPPHGAQGLFHVAFEVDKSEYTNTMDFIQAKNIHVVHQHTWPNGSLSFYFHDPDKNVLEIVEKGMWD